MESQTKMENKVSSESKHRNKKQPLTALIEKVLFIENTENSILAQKARDMLQTL